MTEDEVSARLSGAEWMAAAQPFFAVLDGAEGRTRAVGGAVRDTILGIARTKTDIDLATELLPEAVMARARAAGMGAYPTGIEHGTVTLVKENRTAEVTTLRQDVETFGRHARVAFGTDWTADAARRDFTMNALYALADGTVFDPLGGLEDCLAHRVRFIGDADQRIAEDRLRVFRYFRFVATHGEETFDHISLSACANAASALDTVSAERVGSEMMRLLGAARCTMTLSKMVEIGVLDGAVFSRPALRVLDRLEKLGTPDAVTRLAVLLRSGAEPDRLKDGWRLSNAVVKAASRIAEASGMAEDGSLHALAYGYEDIAQEALAVAAALQDDDGVWLARSIETVRDIAPGVFPLSGSDLAQAGFAGPAIGTELRRLEALWVESGFALGREALLGKLRLPE